jgi:hypothetical protein
MWHPWSLGLTHNYRPYNTFDYVAFQVTITRIRSQFSVPERDLYRLAIRAYFICISTYGCSRLNRNLPAGGRWVGDYRIRQVAVAFGIFVLCLMGCPLRQPAYAAEGGTSAYLKGYKDFLSGVLPTAPGVYVRNDVIYYSGNIDATVIGGQVRLQLSQWSLSNLASATFVTPIRVLGGTYAFGAIVPLTKANVKVGIDTSRGNLSSSDSVFNLDDIIVNPVMMGWNSGNFHWMTLVSIATPTAVYNKKNIANTGMNYWSVQPQFSITYYEPNMGLDVSAGLTYVINTEDHATNYLTGNIFHLD